jgi:hypothetical protein
MPAKIESRVADDRYCGNCFLGIVGSLLAFSSFLFCARRRVGAIFQRVSGPNRRRWYAICVHVRCPSFPMRRHSGNMPNNFLKVVQNIGEKMSLSDMTDSDLGALIESTGATIAEIARQGAVIGAAHAGSAGAETRQQLVEAHNRRWAEMREQYDALCAELQRRHSKRGQF